jgi:KDO2-lipid IV(A) lauroyltransferase
MIDRLNHLISFVFLYPLFWIVSRLNFFLLYKLSDLLFYIFYYIIRYRRETVEHNLNLVFPKKTKKEIKNIELKTYQNLTDVLLESIKFSAMSEEEVKKRFQFKNVEVLKELEKTEQDLILMCGHYASWEWVFILDRFFNYDIYGI